MSCHQNPTKTTQANDKSTTNTPEYLELQRETREKVTDYQSLTGIARTIDEMSTVVCNGA